MVGKVARLIPMEDVRVVQLPTTMLGWQLHLHLYPCETPHWLAWTPCEWDFFCYLIVFICVRGNERLPLCYSYLRDVPEFQVYIIGLVVSKTPFP